MNCKAKQSTKREFEEQLIQKFPHRCPYCDQPISYNEFDLKVGEHVIQCFSCKKTFIKVVLNSDEERGSTDPLIDRGKK